MYEFIQGNRENVENSTRRCMERRILYCKSNFIVGSAAVVERLQSTCKYMVTESCKVMTLLLFECIFLEVSHEFTCPDLVSQAIRCSLSDHVSNYIEAVSGNGRYW